MRMRHLLLAATLLAPPGAASASTNSASGLASATVIQPITARQTADLDFGMLASGQATAGTVALAANGASYGGGAVQICGLAGCLAPHTAGFAVTGEAGHAYVVATPAQLAISGITEDGGAAPVLMVENLSVATASRPGAGAFGQIGDDGSDSFTVGGTLSLPATLQPARYHASFAVIVSYN